MNKPKLRVLKWNPNVKNQVLIYISGDSMVAFKAQTFKVDLNPDFEALKNTGKKNGHTHIFLVNNKNLHCINMNMTYPNKKQELINDFKDLLEYQKYLKEKIWKN